MRITWGTGIAIFYTAFALAMISMVFISRQYDPGLVSRDYYDLDIHYQAHLLKKQRTAQLKFLPQLVVEAGYLTIVFPDTLHVSTGRAHFFRGPDARSDFEVSLLGGLGSNTRVYTGGKAGGRWHVVLEWDDGGLEYYLPATVTL
jgi:hypothetical protein